MTHNHKVPDKMILQLVTYSDKLSKKSNTHFTKYETELRPFFRILRNVTSKCFVFSS